MCVGVRGALARHAGWHPGGTKCSSGVVCLKEGAHVLDGCVIGLSVVLGDGLGLQQGCAFHAQFGWAPRPDIEHLVVAGSFVRADEPANSL